MAYTEAAKRATIKYQRENYDLFHIRIPKANKARYADHADMMGESLTAFILRSMEETYRRDRLRVREAMKNAPRDPIDIEDTE